MQKYLHDHILSEDHDGLLNNVEISLIDKIDWRRGVVVIIASLLHSFIQ